MMIASSACFLVVLLSAIFVSYRWYSTARALREAQQSAGSLALRLTEAEQLAQLWRVSATRALVAQRWIRNAADQREAGPTTWEPALIACAQAACLAPDDMALLAELRTLAADAESLEVTPAQQAAIPFREALRELRSFQVASDARLLELCANPVAPQDQWDREALDVARTRVLFHGHRAARNIAAQRLAARPAG